MTLLGKQCSRDVSFLPAVVSHCSSSTNLIKEEKHNLPQAIKLKPQTNLLLSPVSSLFFVLILALIGLHQLNGKGREVFFCIFWAEIGIFVKPGKLQNVHYTFFIHSSAKVTEKQKFAENCLLYIDYIIHFLSRAHALLCGGDLLHL